MEIAFPWLEVFQLTTEIAKMIQNLIDFLDKRRAAKPKMGMAMPDRSHKEYSAGLSGMVVLLVVLASFRLIALCSANRFAY